MSMSRSLTKRKTAKAERHGRLWISGIKQSEKTLKKLEKEAKRKAEELWSKL